MKRLRNHGPRTNNSLSDQEGSNNVPEVPIRSLSLDQKSLRRSTSGFPIHKNSSKSSRSKRRSRFSLEVKIPPSFPAIWSQFQKSGDLTDAIIKTSNGEVSVHRNIISAVSPYFKAIFAKTAKEFLLSKTTVQIPQLDSDSIAVILDFIYTGICKITSDNVEKILPLAEQFQILGLIQLCCEFLIKKLSPDNCLEIFKYGKSYFCPDLEKEARRFILLNFRHIHNKPEFFQLDFHNLEEFLRDDRLNLQNEETAFTVLCKWIEHNPKVRNKHLVELLQCVRFGLITYNYFTTDVLGWKYICESQEAQNSLYDASLFLTALDSRQGNEIDLSDPLARPRIPHDIVFAVGGWSAGSPTSFMESYDIKSDRWFLATGSDVTPRAYHGLVTLGHSIYMVGGFDGNDHFNTVRAYNPVTKTWSEKACMHHPRCYVSCCVLDGKIYALGGYNGRTRMSSVERYDPVTNQWEIIPSMNRQRSDASACSCSGKVYIAGGFNGQEVLNSVEVFDPAEDQWTFVHPMRSPRSGVSLVPYMGFIYAIGGFNGFTRLNTCEKYNPQTPSDWIIVPEMASPRSNFAAVMLEDMIFVIGGFNGTTTIPFVEFYDQKTNEWADAAHMNLNRSALSACVVSGLPNAESYSFLSRVQSVLGLTSQNSQ